MASLRGLAQHMPFLGSEQQPPILLEETFLESRAHCNCPCNVDSLTGRLSRGVPTPPPGSDSPFYSNTYEVHPDMIQETQGTHDSSSAENYGPDAENQGEGDQDQPPMSVQSGEDDHIDDDDSSLPPIPQQL